MQKWKTTFQMGFHHLMEGILNTGTIRRLSETKRRNHFLEKSTRRSKKNSRSKECPNDKERRRL
jgi:hypothetical protein